MKHYRIQPNASKPNAMETYRIHIHYVVASRGSAIAIYTEKLRGCAIADHGDDTGRNTIRSIRNCTLIRKRSWGVAFANCTESSHAFVMEKQKKSWLSNLNETLRNPAQSRPMENIADCSWFTLRSKSLIGRSLLI